MRLRNASMGVVWRRRVAVLRLAKLSAGVPIVLALLGGAAVAQNSDLTPFTLTTTDGGPDGSFALAQVNDENGCKGQNKSPELQWAGVPPKTKSLAVTIFDRTARNGAGYWHWALIDLPPDLRHLDEGVAPKGSKSGQNDFNKAGYGGPCPPKGDKPHSYVLTVWALPETTIPFDAGSKDSEIAGYLMKHKIGKAELTLSYKR